VQRLLAALLLVFAGYAVISNAHAYQVARPMTAGLVPVSATGSSTIAVSAGPGNRYGWVSVTGGRVQVDLTRGPAGSGYGFASDSTYKLKKLVMIENNDTVTKTVSISVTGNTDVNVSFSGHINGGGETAGATFVLNPGDYVEVNMEFIATGAGSNALGFTVTAIN